MSTPTKLPRQSRRPARRTRGGTQPLPLSREDVLDAALPLLAVHGVDGLTVRAVADALGISSPAIYHYVSGRDDLIDRLCERAAADIDLDVDPECPRTDAIVAVLLRMGRAFARYPGVASRVLIARRRSPSADRITDVVRHLVLDGGFGTDLADDVLAALRFVFAGWLLNGESDAGVLEQSIRAVLRGFAP